jgi:probable HAF family extracellular repeat protein
MRLLTPAILAAFLATAVHAQSPRYLLKDLGTLPGATFSQASDVTDSGIVAGISTRQHRPRDQQPRSSRRNFVPGPGQQAVLQDPRLPLDEGAAHDRLGTLAGDVASVATNINDTGEVIGVSADTSGNIRALHWQRGTMEDLNSLVDSAPYLLFAQTINASGTIVGFGVHKETGDMHPFQAIADRTSPGR